MKDKIVWKELNGDKTKAAFSKSREMMNMLGAQLTVGIQCFEPQAMHSGC